MTSTNASLLTVKGLHVSVDGREVLRGIDLEIRRGETHVLLGPNGSGKTTLLNALIGMPGYRVTEGEMRFDGHDLSGLTVDERARLGIGIAFQRSPSVRGISLATMMRLSGGGGLDSKRLASIAQSLDVTQLLERDVNAGFSGGEAKRAEMAQLLAQEPLLSLFDEPESGVDLENIAIVGMAMRRLLKGERASDPKRSGLIITHTGHILSFVNADFGHVLYDGRLACAGNPRDLVTEIAEHGFEKCVECMLCKR